ASKDKYKRLLKAAQSGSPGIVAPVDLVAGEGQMKSDSAAYEAMRQQARSYKDLSGYLYITAPFDGVVVARKAEPGALVSVNNMLLTVQDNHVLWLRVVIPEIYAAAAVPDKLSFHVDAYPQQRFTGVLQRKTETIDPGTRTELWEYEVANQQHILKAGAFVNAHLELRRHAPSFLVAPAAIASRWNVSS
ncbi:efflux RND transporter periplasmic adaptor subunit, partial [Nostoc sp. PA-18-2419]|uniref:efflux RND transporter periplasmic adaptor subunit n=1 Tax=Nostoc sp. PA-18-2419 TaxID=2575443 RepID=UPI001108AB5A